MTPWKKGWDRISVLPAAPYDVPRRWGGSQRSLCGECEKREREIGH